MPDSERYNSINGPVSKLEKKRWLMVLLFAGVNAMNNCIWLSFGPIADSATSFFEVDSFLINMLSMLFMAIALLCTIPASWCLDHIGLFDYLRFGFDIILLKFDLKLFVTLFFAIFVYVIFIYFCLFLLIILLFNLFIYLLRTRKTNKNICSIECIWSMA
jgi:hypothetical protein